MTTVNRIEDVRYNPAPHEDDYHFKPVFIMKVYTKHKKPQLREFPYDSQLDDGRSFLTAFWPNYAQRKGLGSWTETWYDNGAECNVCYCKKEYGKYVEPPLMHNALCSFIFCHECWQKAGRPEVCLQCRLPGFGEGHKCIEHFQRQRRMQAQAMQIIHLIDYSDDEAREVVEFAGPL